MVVGPGSRPNQRVAPIFAHDGPMGKTDPDRHRFKLVDFGSRPEEEHLGCHRRSGNLNLQYLDRQHSICVVCQVPGGGRQGVWSRMTALRRISNLCMAATRATFLGLPRATSRV